MTHSGGEPRWDIVTDHGGAGKARVFPQLSQNKTSGRFPHGLRKGVVRNGEVSVRCKSVSGEVDQACGIVWRYRDPNNY